MSARPPQEISCDGLGEEVGDFTSSAALFVQPLLRDKAEVVLVRALGRIWVRRHGGLAGPWRFVWTKDPAHLDRSEEVSLRLAEVGSRVSGRFSWRGREYWFLGRRRPR